MTMSCWGDLIGQGQPLSRLVPWGGLTPGQWTLLERINPIHAPVLGFETARQGRWRRADLALLVLSQQWSRWGRLLEPWLEDGQRLAPDLPVAALADFLHLDHCRPETWLELCGDLQQGHNAGLMLFKNPHQPLNLAQGRDLCLAFALQQQTSLSGLPLQMIEDTWWDAAEAHGLQLIHQIGINLRERPIQWRLLLGAAPESERHLQALNLPEPWHDDLRQWPHQVALIPNRSFECFGLEILPRYRRSLDLGELQTVPPTGVEQWPGLLLQDGLLTTARRQQLDGLATATECTLKAGLPLTLLSGVNHLKITLAQGQPRDIKAYAGAFARARTQAVQTPPPPDQALRSALEQHWRQHRNEAWEGFQLNPGSSDRWVAAAVLALLAQQRLEPSLERLRGQRCQQLLHTLTPLQPIGYSQRTPADADSTIWLQRLLIRSGHGANGALERFIACHWSDAGISTYRPESGIAAFINRPLEDCQGWFAPHDCVLANLTALPGSLQNAALGLLRRRVQSGAFQSTWWPAPGWALALAPRGSLPLQAVLELVDQPLPNNAVACLGARLGQRLWRMQRALALLRHGNAKLRLESCLMILELVRQHEGFGQLACLQIPDPCCRTGTSEPTWALDSGLEGSLNIDRLGHFSAALVGSALDAEDLG